MSLNPSDFHILAVDDEESIRSVLDSTLKSFGYNIACADSAEAALELMSRDPLPHIVMTDIRMAGMNGIELLSEIKKISPQVEVIIMTSYASIETAIEAIRLGAYDYIHKPFEDIKEIKTLLERTTKKIYLELENQFLIRRIQEMAIKDGLTGLYNRRHFNDSLAEEFKRANRLKHPLSILLFDVDKFKNFNDTNGHQLGDNCLKTVGQVLAQNSRASDIPCRYGGEEFCLILPHTGKDGAIEKAEILRKHVENTIIEGGEKQPLGKVTISIGVAEYPSHANTFETLIQAADEALYHVKEAGRNGVRMAKPGDNHRPEFEPIEVKTSEPVHAKRKAA